MYHNKPIPSVLQELNTNLEGGLSSSDVDLLLAKHGKNKLQDKKKKTNFQRFLDQFKDVMILILILAAIVSFVIAFVEKNPKEFFEPVLILLIARSHSADRNYQRHHGCYARKQGRKSS